MISTAKNMNIERGRSSNSQPILSEQSMPPNGIRTPTFVGVCQEPPPCRRHDRAAMLALWHGTAGWLARAWWPRSGGVSCQTWRCFRDGHSLFYECLLFAPRGVCLAACQEPPPCRRHDRARMLALWHWTAGWLARVWWPRSSGVSC